MIDRDWIVISERIKKQISKGAIIPYLGRECLVVALSICDYDDDNNGCVVSIFTQYADKLGVIHDFKFNSYHFPIILGDV